MMIAKPDSDGGLFDAAYGDISYRDTTNDGNQGSVFEAGDTASVDELELESKRLTEHLNFLQSLARMWSVAADIAVMSAEDKTEQTRIRRFLAGPNAPAKTASACWNC